MRALSRTSKNGWQHHFKSPIGLKDGQTYTTLFRTHIPQTSFKIGRRILSLVWQFSQAIEFDFIILKN